MVCRDGAGAGVDTHTEREIEPWFVCLFGWARLWESLAACTTSYRVRMLAFVSGCFFNECHLLGVALKSDTININNWAVV